MEIWMKGGTTDLVLPVVVTGCTRWSDLEQHSYGVGHTQTHNTMRVIQITITQHRNHAATIGEHALAP